MSTIEGGMICTNSKEIDSLAKMKRGHGLLRDSQNQKLINNVKSATILADMYGSDHCPVEIDVEF